jgi:signal transduction histidine kinase
MVLLRDAPWEHTSPLAADETSEQESLCACFVQYMTQLCDAPLGTMWSVDPVQNRLFLVASAGPLASLLSVPVLDVNKVPCGIGVQRRRETVIDDVDGVDACKFGDPALQGRVRRMLCLPILNTWNQNLVTFLLNVFDPRKHNPASSDDLAMYSRSFASAVERCLQDRAMQLAHRMEVELRAVAHHDVDANCCRLSALLCSQLRCESVIVFLQSALDQLEQRGVAGKGLSRNGARVARERAESVWRENREQLVLPTRRSPHSAEMDHTQWAHLILPLRDPAGAPCGAVVCSRAPRDALVPLFTYGDVTVIEGVLSAFSPRLEVLQSAWHRVEAMNKLGHELRTPLVAFRAALERLRAECTEKQLTFRMDHFQNLDDFCEQMQRLLVEFGTLRRGPTPVRLQTAKVNMLSDVIAPAKRFLAPLWERLNLDQAKVRHDGFSDLPPVQIDVQLFRQAVFNLLENATKYRVPSSPSLVINIEATISQRRGIELVFRDYGIGVPAGWSERIFGQGIRGPDSYLYDISGQGLGLYLARQFVEAHGGKIHLRRNGAPTEFVIWLPIWCCVHDK